VLVGTGARLRVLPAIFDELKNNYPAYVDNSLTRGAAYLTPEDIERRRAWLGRIDPMVIHGDFEACDAFDIMDRVGEIRLPTLIIVGRDDVMTPVKYAEFLSQKIPGSRLVIIERAGHAVPMERGDEVNRAIDEFVKTLDPAAAR
ncbi:MAG TPA: alpha/beta hydrolase, partial [Dehalococcoidia bacterium]|nr:alpha/beta hydrolase [Dehalococcoidia bacterium]